MANHGTSINALGGITPFMVQITDFMADTLLNRGASALASIPQAIAHDSSITDLTILDNDYTFEKPDAEYQLDHSPNVDEFLNAANTEYNAFDIPEGLTPFEVDGKALELVDLATGLSARAFTTDDQQLIISYSGTTGGDNLFLNPLQVVGQLAADVEIMGGQVSQAQTDAVSFAQYVVNEANQQGIATDDIFVTGHSLGATEAEYVSQQTGLGGIAFEGAGIPVDEDAVGDGSNFASVGSYGDVWYSFASDVEGDQPVSPEYVEGGGELPHFGNQILLGDPQSQEDLSERLNQPFHDNWVGVLLDLVAGPHLPQTQADELGVDIHDSFLFDLFGAEGDGQPFEASELGLGELLAANDERLDYHGTSIPDDLQQSQPVEVTGTSTAEHMPIEQLA